MQSREQVGLMVLAFVIFIVDHPWLVLSEARRANSVLRAHNLDEPLAQVLRASDGRASELFPTNLKHLFGYDGALCSLMHEPRRGCSQFTSIQRPRQASSHQTTTSLSSSNGSAISTSSWRTSA